MFNTVTRFCHLGKEFGNRHAEGRGWCFSRIKVTSFLIVILGLLMWLSWGDIVQAQCPSGLEVYDGTGMFGKAKTTDPPQTVGCWVVANMGGCGSFSFSVSPGNPQDSAFSIVDSGTYILNPGEAKVVRIRFTPNGSSPHDAKFNITTNDGQSRTRWVHAEEGTPVVRALTIHSVNVCGCSSSYWVGLSPADKYGNYTTNSGVTTFYYDDGTQVTLGVKVGTDIRGWRKNGGVLVYGSGVHREVTVTIDSSFAMEAVWVRLGGVSSTDTSCGWYVPPAPSSLTATAISSSSIHVSWGYTSTLASGFYVFRDGKLIALDYDGNDTGLNSNTTYCYYAKAFNKCGQSGASNHDCATTFPGAAGRTLTVDSSNSSGDPIGGVYITVTPTDNNGLSSGTTPFARTYDDGTVVTLTAPSTPFQEWLQDGVHASSSTTVNVTMYANHRMTAVYGTAPAERTLTVYSSNPSSGVYITVSPNDNNGSSSGTTPFTRTYDNGTVVTLTAPSPAAGNPFLKWQKDGVDYATSRTTNVTMDANHTMTDVYGPSGEAPAAPSNLTASATSSYQIDLNWKDNSDNETSFWIERKTGSSGTFQHLDLVLANETSYSDYSVTPNTTYYYRVRAYSSDTSLYSDYSNEAFATFSIGPCGPPDEDFETGDFSEFPWNTSNPLGIPDWFVTNLEKHHGSFSARAGDVGDYQGTGLKVALTTGGGNICFWFKVSSEYTYDFLMFYIDGVEKGRWSGERDWAQISFPVSAGQHTFKWNYSKDVSISSGADSAWIDDIDFPPNDTPAVFLVTREGDVYADQAYYGQQFYTGSADVAEWVPISEPVEPGDVLELDPERPGYYRKSRGQCSNLVAGVVSSDPGVILGSESQTSDSGLPAPDTALLALLGIVPVKVTDEGGPIQPGDLLVTSSTLGHAMRWDPDDGSPCNLVGKALEPLTEESGIILALLTAH